MPEDLTDELTPDILLRAYAMGIFPMSDGRDDPDIHWIDPRRRGVLPLDGFHISRSLARRIRSRAFRVTADHGVRRTWSRPAPTETRPGSATASNSFTSQLHAQGFAHSVEVWHADSWSAVSMA